MATDLNGKVAIVTGANSGIGYETSLALARRGAKVILACRDRKAEATAELIRAAAPGAQVVAGPPLDLKSQSSVRDFAAEVQKSHPEIHILVNNAGISFAKKEMMEGVQVYTQTNHLGPYTLTRLLEKTLVKSKARVVTVSSITHRMVRIRDPSTFFTEFKTYYEHTKLANVLFAFELQRRLGPLGVTSAAADPGAVNSPIWDKSPSFKQGFMRTVMNWCYSPSYDGAASIIHAATVPWEKERKVIKGTPAMPAQDLRYYAKGLFAASSICNSVGYGKGFMKTWWDLTAFLYSLMDWPLRNLSGGSLASWMGPVKASKAAYDEDMASRLWDVSAYYAQLPKTPVL